MFQRKHGWLIAFQVTSSALRSATIPTLLSSAYRDTSKRKIKLRCCLLLKQCELWNRYVFCCRVEAIFSTRREGLTSPNTTPSVRTTHSAGITQSSARSATGLLCLAAAGSVTLEYDNTHLRPISSGPNNVATFCVHHSHAPNSGDVGRTRHNDQCLTTLT